MGQTAQATVGTIFEVNNLGRKATVWRNTPVKVHVQHSLVVVTYITREDGTSQGGQQVFITNAELLQGRQSNMSLISWFSSRLKRVESSSSADEAVYIHTQVLEGSSDFAA